MLNSWSLSLPFCKVGTWADTQMFITTCIMISPHVAPPPRLALGPADGEGSFQCPFTIPSGKCYHGHRVSHGSPEAAAQTPETVPVCSGPWWVCRAEKSPCCGEQSLKDPPSCSGLPEHTAWHGEVTTPAPWAVIPSLLGTPICPASESGTWGCVGRGWGSAVMRQSLESIGQSVQ